MRGKKASTKKKDIEIHGKHAERCLWRGIGSIGREGWSFWRTERCCMVMHGALPVGRRSLQELISWRPNQWICANVVSFNAALSCFRKAWPELKSPHLQKHSVIFELTYMDSKLWMCLRFAYEWPSDRGNMIRKLANRRNLEPTWLLRLAWSDLICDFLIISHDFLIFSQLLSRCSWRIFAWLSTSTLSLAGVAMAKGGLFSESHHADLQQDIPQRSRGRMTRKVSGQQETVWHDTRLFKRHICCCLIHSHPGSYSLNRVSYYLFRWYRYTNVYMLKRCFGRCPVGLPKRSRLMMCSGAQAFSCWIVQMISVCPSRFFSEDLSSLKQRC